MGMGNLQTQAAPRNAVWDRVLMGALLAAVVIGLLGLASATGWEDTLVQLAKLTPAAIAFLLFLSIANYGMRAARWDLFARELGLPTSFATNARHYLGGFAVTVTPGRVGELIRMRWLRCETGWTFERTAPLALVDRAADLAAMGLMLGAAVALSTMGITLALPIALGSIAAAVVATRPTLLSAIVSGFYRLTGRFPRPMARIRAAARTISVFSTPRIIIIAGMLSALGWLAEGWAFHLLLVWMGAALPFWSAVAIFLFSTLAGGLTGAPGGLGGAEAAMVALLTLEGVPLDAAIAATAVIRLTTLWFAIGLGVLVFPIAERSAHRAEKKETR
ncbi:MAG: flippase-like domain-containing protein [Rhodobacteraceae bacterium]|nr:flippase-like domain-containing protein [Paracoccaceae bacterium]